LYALLFAQNFILVKSGCYRYALLTENIPNFLSNQAMKSS
jgi:hypothetical protein